MRNRGEVRRCEYLRGAAVLWQQDGGWLSKKACAGVEVEGGRVIGDAGGGVHAMPMRFVCCVRRGERDDQAMAQGGRDWVSGREVTILIMIIMAIATEDDDDMQYDLSRAVYLHSLAGLQCITTASKRRCIQTPTSRAKAQMTTSNTTRLSRLFGQVLPSQSNNPNNEP